MSEFNLNLTNNVHLSNTRVDGYIYIIRAYQDYYKIGMTSSPRRRISSLRSGLPEEPISMEFYWVGDVSLEFNLHEMFPTRRMNGEWFEFDEDEVERIRQRILDQGGTFAEVL